jgi:hypothetical protein
MKAQNIVSVKEESGLEPDNYSQLFDKCLLKY